MMQACRLLFPLALMVMAGGSALAQTCNASIPASTPTAQFTDNGDGTVTDGKTGLMWKRCAEGQAWSGGACTGTAAAYTWQQALQQAGVVGGAGGGFAGRTDWRLPNIKELESIVEERCLNPSINTAVFPNTPASDTWSASANANDLVSAWYVNFGLGHAGGYPKRDGKRVRLVRAGRSFDSFDSCGPSGLCAYTQPTSIPRLVNIATRGRVQTGANVMIAGFIIGGTTPKKVLITARGPSVAVLPSEVPLLMADPKMTLYSGATAIATNDDWQTMITPPSGSPVTLLPADQIPTTQSPGSAKEAAILTTLAPGAYTAIVERVGGATGLSIVEVFEVDNPQVPLVNIATRALVESGAHVMIAGFIIQGDGPKKVLVTARGQSLAVPESERELLMKNPWLQLYSGTTPIAENDDWQTLVPQPIGSPVNLLPPTDIPGTQKPGHVKDAAILTTLAPGAYTAIVTDATPGIAIVEVFAQ